jgi:hypothetical protein
VQRDDLVPPELGYQWCVIKLGMLRLPFVSYCGRRWVWQFGWQPSGFCTAKLNRRREPAACAAPSSMPQRERSYAARIVRMRAGRFQG